MAIEILHHSVRKHSNQREDDPRCDPPVQHRRLCNHQLQAIVFGARYKQWSAAMSHTPGKVFLHHSQHEALQAEL